MLLIVSPEILSASKNLDSLVENIPIFFHGIANQLSPSMQEWGIIDSIERATSVDEIVQKQVISLPVKRVASQESKEVVLKRRSIHVMDKESSTITQAEFHTLLRSVEGSLDAKKSATHLVIFIHRVENLASGLYILLRNSKTKDILQTEMNSNFIWKEQDFSSLYLLHEHDYRLFSKTVSCGQDIASDGAFSLGMLSEFAGQLATFGAHRYKELYWECGAIGQQLYLEATSMGLSGTGIGCFLDDMMHEVLGLKNNKFQILYHFTLGRGYVDSRIQTKPAYKRENA
jgi:nitroreductase